MLTKDRMPIGTFPVIVQHEEASAMQDGRHVSTSMVPFVSVLLVSRGADHLIIPTPSADERERAEFGMSKLPAERKSLVTLFDTSGEELRRVRSYLEPLRKQAQKWPEDAFVYFAHDFLYEIICATRKRAGILSTSVSVVRDFVPIIDPMVFSGEARFRLAELCRLVCSYEPLTVDHGMYDVDASSGSVATASKILDMAEFRAVVAESGRIGYLKNPLIAFRALKEKFSDLIRRPEVKPLLKLASTAADAAGAGGLGEAAGEALGLSATDQRAEFRPPFISIGPARLSMYRAALREALPGAVPPQGTIMLYERFRNGKAGGRWLNVGEESKLQREAEAGLSPRHKKYTEALQALNRIAGN